MSSNTKSRKAYRGDAASSLPTLPDLRVNKHTAKVFKPINLAQESYLNKINNNVITFSTGPAGTGKTFVAAMAAAKSFNNKEIDKIIVSRPMVEAGEKMGFLPGDMNEKFTPYVAPFLEALSRIMGTGQVNALIEHQKIVFLPLAYMRGHSWDRTFVVLDEAQNVTKAQMKLFLTRIGKDTTVIVDGDISQKDELDNRTYADGLEDAIQRLAGVRGVAVHRFYDGDIVRSGIVRDIIIAYNDNPKYDDLEMDEDDDREGLFRVLK
jgi:phosphate starvation-inducible PhoH-like protein